MRCRELNIFKILVIFGDLFLILWEFIELFLNFLGIFWEFFGNFWKVILMEGITLFVKILVFAKILSQCKRKFRSLENYGISIQDWLLDVMSSIKFVLSSYFLYKIRLKNCYFLQPFENKFLPIIQKLINLTDFIFVERWRWKWLTKKKRNSWVSSKTSRVSWRGSFSIWNLHRFLKKYYSWYWFLKKEM